MNISDILVSALRTQGHKITKNRVSILEFLSNQKKPVSADLVLEHIQNEHQSAHKTTIYRELEFLLVQNFIKEVEFGDGKKRYEIAINRPHHHHVVCVSCKRVEDIPLEENLSVQEKKIEEITNFKLTSHMIEFFGKCESCR